MLEYFKNSFKRKVARRVTKEYPTRVDTFQIEGYGEVKFANWENPLVKSKVIEKSAIDFFKKFLSPGDWAIDIGGNVGEMSLQMSLITGKEGLVISFDPNKYVFKVLEQNISLNPDKTNIVAYNLAIADKEADFYYNSSEASFSNGGIAETADNKHGKYSIGEQVHGVPLRKFLEQKHPEFATKLKLIKIDTEGYDKEIIKSISDLLAQYKPAVISECFGGNNAEEKYEQFQLLKDMGYKLYYFGDLADESQVEEIKTKEDMLKWKHFDLYAIAE